MSDSKTTEGGAFGGVEDLYREVILEHFRSPKNKGHLKNPSAKAEGVNPLCGDQISISILVEGEKLKEIRFEGHGCAISQSSASMMTALLKGKTLKKANVILSTFKNKMGVEKKVDPAESVDIGDLESLEGVKRYPVRIKCALLAWNTFLKSLSNLKK